MDWDSNLPTMDARAYMEALKIRKITIVMVEIGKKFSPWRLVEMANFLRGLSKHHKFVELASS
jgi:hypothetical protein